MNVQKILKRFLCHMSTTRKTRDKIQIKEGTYRCFREILKPSLVPSVVDEPLSALLVSGGDGRVGGAVAPVIR
jgi:hypothetical protein